MKEKIRLEYIALISVTQKNSKNKIYVNYWPIKMYFTIMIVFIVKLISYNKLRNNSREIEFQLVQEEIEQIDELIKKGEYSLNWNSEGIIFTIIF